MTVRIRHLGLQPYLQVWQEMREFTDRRDSEDADQIWFVEHEPVFTLGQAGRTEHVLNAGEIPVIKTDRGGQVTYHGPGQLVAYTLLDLRRHRLGVRELVVRLENAVVALLADQDIIAAGRRDAPGVYVDGAKIAALGLRIRRGCSYHGLALNVDADLSPFSRINPCGYARLPVTSMARLGCRLTVDDTAGLLLDKLCERFDVHESGEADPWEHGTS